VVFEIVYILKVNIYCISSYIVIILLIIVNLMAVTSDFTLRIAWIMSFTLQRVGSSALILQIREVSKARCISMNIAYYEIYNFITVFRMDFY